MLLYKLTEIRASARAGTDLLRFLAILLVLTLLVRGTAAVTMPVVTVTAAYQGTVSHTFTVSGQIAPGTGIPLELPEGLLVEQVLVRPDETVTQGQALAVVSCDDVQELLTQTRATLEQLRVQAGQLQDGETADSFAWQQAQQQLDRAYAACRETEEQTGQAVADAGAALDAARQQLAEVESRQPCDPEDPSVQAMATPEQARAAEAYTAWQTEHEQAQSAVEQAEDGLAAAQQAASDARSAALSAAQSAEDTRDSARHSYEKEAEQIADANETDRAEAGVLLAQIAQQQTLLDRLEELQAAGGQVLAPGDGVLTELDLTVGQPSPAVAGLLAAQDAGYTLSAELTDDQLTLVTAGGTCSATQGQLTAAAEPESIAQDGTVQFRLAQASWQTGTASLTFSGTGGTAGLCLPATAVNSDNAGDFVYLVETRNTVMGVQNVLVRLAVTVEERGDSVVRVSGALSGEERIVSGSSKPLSAGAQVRVEE